MKRPSRLIVQGVTPDASEEQILRTAQEELACQLTDVVFRRTGLGFSRNFDEQAQARLATLLGRELGWSGVEQERQQQCVRQEFERRAGRSVGPTLQGSVVSRPRTR